MKRIYTTLIYLVFLIRIVSAQYYEPDTIIECRSGKLDSILFAENKFHEFKHIQIRGTMDMSDFQALNILQQYKTYYREKAEDPNNDYQPLRAVDLSEVSITEFTDSMHVVGDVTQIFEANDLQTVAFAGDTLIEMIVLPRSLTKIGSSAFQGCKNLKYFHIPDNVTEIESYAFYSCASLKFLTLPPAVKSLGAYAFAHCTSMTSINLSTSMTKIVEGTFDGCTSLDYIEMSENLDSIGRFAFRNCTSLFDLTLPNNINYIGEQVFNGCSKLQYLDLPAQLTEINEGLFINCSSLFYLKIPPKVSTIWMYPFIGCTSMQILDIPASVTFIRYDAFEGFAPYIKVNVDNPNYCAESGVLFNKNRTRLIRCPTKREGSFELPSSVRTIYNYAFQNCKLLTDVIVPENVELICDKAFQGCVALRNVAILNPNAEFVSNNTFSECNSLQSLTVHNQEPDNLELAENIFSNVDMNTCVLYVPVGSKSLYESSFLWRNFKHIVEVKPPSVTLSLSEYSPTNSTLNLVGKITDAGSHQLRRYGYCFNSTGMPTLNDESHDLCSITEDGTFPIIKNVLENTTYYVRAFGYSSAGLVYSEEFVFSTIPSTSLVNSSRTDSDYLLEDTIMTLEVPGASHYEYVFENSVNNEIITQIVNKPYLILDSVSGLEAGSVYMVKVRAVVNDKYGVFGEESQIRLKYFTTEDSFIVTDTNVLMELYPTVATSFVTIKTSLDYAGSDIIIIDMNGFNAKTLTMKNNSIDLDLSSLSKGIYLVQLVRGHELIAQKQLVKY